MSAAPALKADPFPPPPCCEHDLFAGVRAHAAQQAIRRYGDRILAMEEILEGLDDTDAVDALAAMGVPIGEVRTWLAFYGGVGVRHGAQGVCRDGVGLVLKGGKVVTVLSRRWIAGMNAALRSRTGCRSSRTGASCPRRRSSSGIASPPPRPRSCGRGTYGVGKEAVKALLAERVFEVDGEERYESVGISIKVPSMPVIRRGAGLLVYAYADQPDPAPRVLKRGLGFQPVPAPGGLYMTSTLRVLSLTPFHVRLCHSGRIEQSCSWGSYDRLTGSDDRQPAIEELDALGTLAP